MNISMLRRSSHDPSKSDGLREGGDMKIGLMIDEDLNRACVIKQIKNQFKNQKPQYVDSTIPMDFIDKDGFDLVVVDWGGISIGIGNSMSEHYVNYANRYAEDHPNTLLIYITVMGKHWLDSEGVNFEKLQNIKWCNTTEIKKCFEDWKKDRS